MYNFDTCTFCAMLVLNVVWSLIQGLQICKFRSYRLCLAMVHLKLVNLSVASYAASYTTGH